MSDKQSLCPNCHTSKYYSTSAGWKCGFCGHAEPPDYAKKEPAMSDKPSGNTPEAMGIETTIPQPEAAVEVNPQEPYLPPLEKYELWYCEKSKAGYCWTCDESFDTLEEALAKKQPHDRIFHICDSPYPSPELALIAIEAMDYECDNEAEMNMDKVIYNRKRYRAARAAQKGDGK